MNNSLSSHICDRVAFCNFTRINPATKSTKSYHGYDERDDLNHEHTPASWL